MKFQGPQWYNSFLGLTVSFRWGKSDYWVLPWSQHVNIEGFWMGIQVWKPYLLKLLIDSKTLISKVIEVFRLTFSWQEGFNFKTRGTHRFTGTFHWLTILPFAHVVTALFLQQSLNILQPGLALCMCDPCSTQKPALRKTLYFNTLFYHSEILNQGPHFYFLLAFQIM